MKKFVILMLALMLALTSVSAMAGNLTGSGTATEPSTLTTKLIFELPESFEWSIPDEVTLTDAIFNENGAGAVEVIMTSAILKDHHMVKFSAPSPFSMTESDSMVELDASFVGYIRVDMEYVDHCLDGDPMSLFVKATKPSTLYAGTYTADVTITAEIITV